MSQKEVIITEPQARKMICSVAGMMHDKIMASPLVLISSDCYGANMHKTWVFTVDEKLVIGTFEKYWSGIKMICSVLHGNPRTYFFNYEGDRSTSKALKSQTEE